MLIMYRTRSYKSTDKMGDLICENYNLLQVLSRFGISLGFGDKTVQEVCNINNVDCSTFLVVVNFLTEDTDRMQDHLSNISVRSLMSYLKRAHSYFLDFQLPSIREKLVNSVNCTKEKEVSFLIIQFFDAFVNEVNKHMEYENRRVFSYVESLLNNEKPDGFSISEFARHHDRVNVKLTELKNIIIKYYPGQEDNQELIATLFDIFSCEEDLASHNKVEDLLFVPAIMELEKEVK